MRTRKNKAEYIGPNSRFRIYLTDQGVQIFDAERTDQAGKATQVHTAIDRAAAVEWVNAAIAADPSMAITLD